MSSIKSTDDPCIRFARLMAELYYFMAKEMVTELGEEKGREAVLHAVREFGKARARAMKEEAEAQGLELTGIDTYRTVRDMPGTGWQTNPNNTLEISFCPMEDTWREYGEEGRKLGYLYCQIDYVLYDAFGIDMERPFCLAKGDGKCLFQLREKLKTNLG